MLVTASKLAAAKVTVRVRLKIDQKVSGVSLSEGDVVEVSAEEARRLKNMGRADIVPFDFDGGDAPKRANR